ncbi:hypothetical protein AX774_g6874 [Zancudomyces culisetae]|uniref:Uncharacterized protein n=1 Tax=Zancudomyces culisetae TaxID=1213189 RepID=A0A1R1PFL5_ZANCU|nr:hypothetical protein AX774_g6874 [Zancudomyces culisetae]|eukprot:OMH79703.1 hypothetical protein AX774_g6874 [Zancudomyces culisetae]
MVDCTITRKIQSVQGFFNLMYNQYSSVLVDLNNITLPRIPIDALEHNSAINAILTNNVDDLLFTKPLASSFKKFKKLLVGRESTDYKNDSSTDTGDTPGDEDRFGGYSGGLIKLITESILSTLFLDLRL